MKGHRASFTKYRKLEITSCILLDHNGARLEINKCIHQLFEIEQHTIVRWMDPWRNNKSQNEFPESNENGNTTCLNLWETMKETFIVTPAYTEISDHSQINSSVVDLKLLEKKTPNCKSVDGKKYLRRGQKWMKWKVKMQQGINEAIE